MTSIYQRALGADFARLHPQIQRRFGFSSADGVAAIGTRRHGRALARAARTRCRSCTSGTWRRIMFPEQGRDVPFTIENYAYRDGFGRETVTWIRTFATRRRRRFDAYMIYSRGARPDRRLPRHAPAPGGRHRAVRSTSAAGMRIRSGAQRFYEGPVGLHASRCSSRASPTSASGTTTRPGSSASRSRSTIAAGGRSSAIAAPSTWNGARTGRLDAPGHTAGAGGAAGVGTVRA